MLADEWNEWAPEGAIIFLDEVQNIYRPRSGTKSIPPSIMAFETHRHKGLDFYLVSQSPRLFDSNIHAFIARHVHFKQNYMRRIAYEWPEVKTNVQSTSDAISSTYSLDKKVFKLFKSSSMHTKISRKIPTALFAIPLLLVVFVAGVFYVKNSMASRMGLEDKKEDIVKLPDSIKKNNSLVDVEEPTFTSSNSPVKLDFPIFSGVVIDIKTSKCTAYSQQGTILDNVTQESCYKFQQNKSFNPYKTYLSNLNKKEEGGSLSAPPPR